MWTYVDTFALSNFGDFSTTTSEKIEQCKKFVRKVLELHRAPLIKKMVIRIDGLSTTDDDLDYVTWIQTVVFTKNVQSLHLSFPRPQHWRFCFFSSNTLVELILALPDITTIMESPTPPFFPNLKMLELYGPRDCTDSINRFITGSPILEYFRLSSYTYPFPAETCCISSATLKQLDLYTNKRIELNTPALEVLGIRKTLNLELLVKSSMPSLHEVHITMGLSESVAFGFLKNFSNVSVLSLEVMKYSHDAIFDLPVHFHNLTILDIIAPLDLVRRFIETSPNLQVITLGKARDSVYVIWEEPQQVPMCLLSSVRTICIKGYANEKEIDLVIKYLLANAEVLEHMEIHTPECYEDSYNFKFDMLQKISKFRRASKLCELSFHVQDYL